MTNPIGNAATEPKPPLLVTGKRLDQILDTRDDAMVATFDQFKVEVVERMDAIAKLQDQMQELLVSAMAVIKVNNIHQPQAESIEVKYLVERGEPAWLYEVSADSAGRELASGGTYYRDVTIREKFHADQETVREAASVVGQLRKLTR